MSELTENWLPDSEWEGVQRIVPILCVDAMPVRSVHGRVEVGLIARHNPFGPEPVWCPIGGRVRRDELLTSALLRHLRDALDPIDVPDHEVDMQPVYVMQWLPGGPTAQMPWLGLDPRKHSVSLCYSIPVATEPKFRLGGEALAFEWFAPTTLPRVWPGTQQVVDAVVARTLWSA